MMTSMLQRQNSNLSRTLSQTRADLKAKEEELTRAQAAAQASENAVSVIDRTWAAAEEHISQGIARLQENISPNVDGSPPPLIELLPAPPLRPGTVLEEALEGKTKRLVQAVQTLVGAVAERAKEQQSQLRALREGESAVAAPAVVEQVRSDLIRLEATVAGLQKEKGELAVQLSLARDQLTQAHCRCAELDSQISHCRQMLAPAEWSVLTHPHSSPLPRCLPSKPFPESIPPAFPLSSVRALAPFFSPSHPPVPSYSICHLRLPNSSLLPPCLPACLFPSRRPSTSRVNMRTSPPFYPLPPRHPPSFLPQGGIGATHQGASQGAGQESPTTHRLPRGRSGHALSSGRPELRRSAPGLYARIHTPKSLMDVSSGSG